MSFEFSVPDYESDGLRWFLVTGAPRSGTTMFGRLLNTHPSIGCLSEIDLPSLLARIDPLFHEKRLRTASERSLRPTRPPVPRTPGLDEGGPSLPPHAPAPGRASVPSALHRAGLFQIEREEALTRDGMNGSDGALDGALHAAAVARALVEIGLGKRGLTHLGTKIPNLDPVDAVRQVAGTIPNLRVIHVVRRPSDTVNSSLGRRNLARAAADEWHIDTVADACNEWRVNWNRVARAKRQLGERFLAVKYEDLLAGRTDVAEAVTAHLGLSGGLDLSICRALPEELGHYAILPDEKAYLDRVFGAVERAWDEPLDALLARFPTVAFPLPEDGVVGFVAGGEGRLYGDGGLSSPEPWGLWTDGELAQLDMALGDRPGDLLLTLDTTVWRRDEALGFGVVLRAGRWREVRTIEAGPPGQVFRLHALVPRSALPDPARLRLELRVLDPKRAADEPRGDARALGLGLQRLRVDVLPDPEDG